MSDIEEQRKYYERMMDEVGAEYRRRIADLQAENERLWELVRELLTDPDAWDYDYFKYRLRELGVEV